MAMNPDTNAIEPLTEATDTMLDDLVSIAQRPGYEKAQLDDAKRGLLRPNGEPVPGHWSTYRVGEEVDVKGYRWAVAHIGEKHLLLEPVGPVLVGGGNGE